MLKNQRGDALTLAMGAALFVGVSIMVVVAILGNMDAQVKRSRMVNDVEATVLYLNQILNNRDLCTYAMRQHNGQAVLIRNPGNPAANLPNPAPPVVPRLRLPIPRVYLSDPVAYNAIPAAPPIFCSSLGDANGDGVADANPACTATQPNVIVRSMRFAFFNDTNNHKPMMYKGSSSRYWLLSGNFEIDFDFPQQSVLGGDLNVRKFPFSVLYDRDGGGGNINGQVEMCYTKESPALICAQLGGSLNVDSGVCEQMFGHCENPPFRPAVCGGIPGGRCLSGSGLVWTTIYYAATVMPGMQMQCNCMTFCTFPTGP